MSRKKLQFIFKSLISRLIPGKDEAEKNLWKNLFFAALAFHPRFGCKTKV
jgi:hypothetical protein